MKKCAFCGTENKPDALTCEFCEADLPTVEEKVGVFIDNGVKTGDCSVRIHVVGPNKIAVIKAIKEAANLGLASSKEQCEQGLVENISMAAAQEIVDKLRACGATAEILSNGGMPATPTMPQMPRASMGMESEGAANICPVCGTKNNPRALLCEFCGGELRTPEESASAAPADANGYALKIHAIGPNKIAVIKEIKETANLGLADAKTQCEQGYVKNLSLVTAQELMEKVRAQGAEAEVIPASEVPPAPQPIVVTVSEGIKPNIKGAIIVIATTIVLSALIIWACVSCM